MNNSTSADTSTQVEEKPVRDDRRQNFFWCDNQLIDEAGAAVGAYGIAVYAVLCRYANNQTQEAWPTHGRIAELIKASKPTVIAALKALQDAGLIEIVARQYNGTGPQISNTYRLIDKTEWSQNRGKPDCHRDKIGTGATASKVSTGPAPRLPKQNTRSKTQENKTQQQQQRPTSKNAPTPENVVVASAKALPEEAANAALVAQLRELNVLPKVAAKLVRDYPDRIARQIAWLPSRHPKDAAAMIVSAITEDWPAPASLPTSAPKAPERPRATPQQAKEQAARHEQAGELSFAGLSVADQAFVILQCELLGKSRADFMKQFKDREYTGAWRELSAK